MGSAMNYRHAFHAGNHCDVLKHAALALVLDRLAGKDKPFMVLDTHAGRGVYDLESPEAARSGEHLGGIARIAGDPNAPGVLAPYLEAVRRHNPFGDLRWYPGSPAIIRDALRAGDSAKFCELHPEERAALETHMGGDRHVALYDLDGYQAVRAFLPPAERRGLVLIDPPFEKPGEYRRLADAVGAGVRRWASGIFMIWRPVKDEEGYRAFTQQIDALRLPKTLVAALRVAPRQNERLSGSGLFIINPPFGLSKSLAELLPYLADRLATTPGGGWFLRETENDNTVCDVSGSA
jgi:23S rRNA (adenine2030-N6)-methyltransferase